MNGLDIVRRVYTRLRKPSQQALPYKTVLQTISEVIAVKKLDLALSQQNSLATTSDWFTTSSADFSLEELGLQGGVLLPVRIETRAIGSDWETGDDVPIVNYEVLNTSTVGAASFYGDPMRLVFRDNVEYVSNQQYRLIYESDFTEETTLESIVGLPQFFMGMVEVEASWELIDLVEDDSQEWRDFYKLVSKKWEALIIDKRVGWAKYVRMFKGRAQVPKRTFFDNQRRRNQTGFFRG